MSKNLILKILFMLFLTNLIIFNITTFIYAADFNPDDYQPIIDNSGDTKITTITGQIVGAIRILGIIILVITLAIIGIKFMLGSADEKAEYKKIMLPYLIGALLTFSGTELVQYIYNVMK